MYSSIIFSFLIGLSTVRILALDLKITWQSNNIFKVLNTVMIRSSTKSRYKSLVILDTEYGNAQLNPFEGNYEFMVEKYEAPKSYLLKPSNFMKQPKLPLLMVCSIICPIASRAASKIQCTSRNPRKSAKQKKVMYLSPKNEKAMILITLKQTLQILVINTKQDWDSSTRLIVD